MDKSKFAALGERLKLGGERLRTGGAEMGRKVSDKMKEILQPQSQESKMVDEATLDTLEEPNWSLNLRICALLNSNEFNGQEVVKAIKKKIAGKNVESQRLSLDLLETCAMNCDKVFSEVASEKVLDEMVKMIDNPQTNHINRQRALQLIQAWGESEDLGYLPVFHQTYMSLKNRRSASPRVENGNPASVVSPLETGIEELFSVPEGYPYPATDQKNADPYVDYKGPLSAEEKREILVVTRNSIEILSSLLNFETHGEVVEDDLTLSMLERCKDSQPVIQRILESVGDNEAMLFEALNLHEELEHVLAKYAEIKAAIQPPTLATHSSRDLTAVGRYDGEEDDRHEALARDNKGIPAAGEQE